MTEVLVYPSAARTATPAAADVDLEQFNTNALYVVLDVTAVGVTPSITVTIDLVDVASGKTVNLLTSAAITTTGVRVLKVGPGLVAAANLVANEFTPEKVRITVTHGNAVTITYSVTAHLLQ